MSAPLPNFEEKRFELEKRRLKLEELKSERENRFFSKYFGVILTTLVPVLVAAISLVPVWISYISKDKEIELANIQKQIENERIEKDKLHEYNLNRAKFVMENNKTLFGGKPIQLERMALVIELLFPPDEAQRFFEGLKKSTNRLEAKRIWSRAQDKMAGGASSGEMTEDANNYRITLTVTALDPNLQKNITLKDVSITLIDESGIKVYEGTTSTNGVLITNPLPIGNYTVLAKHNNYTAYSSTIKVRKNVPPELTLQMKKK
jgi:hypothetical protein